MCSQLYSNKTFINDINIFWIYFPETQQLDILILHKISYKIIKSKA